MTQPPYSKPVRSFYLFDGKFRFFIGAEHKIDQDDNGNIRKATIVSYDINQEHFEYYGEVIREVVVAFNGTRQVWKTVIGGNVIEHDLK